MASSVPFIGSRMSLVSKAEIRYEGFLHEIDTQNTTVTLKNVRSFGTENRRTDKVIQPKDDVFQYIIFRGTDIKDISVCEPPLPPTFADPAIVQSGPPAGARAQPSVLSNPTTSSSLTPDAVSPSPAFTPFAMPAMPQAKPHPPTVPSPQLFRDAAQTNESQHISPEPLVDQSRSLSTVTEHSQNRGNNQNRQQQQQRPNGGGAGGYRGERNENRSYSAATTRQQYNNRGYNDYAPRSYAYNASGNPYNSYGGNNGYRNNGNAPNACDRNNRPMGQNRNYNNYQNNYRWNQGGMNRRMGGGPGGRMGDASGTGDLKIDEEFDIDDANRKFDKSQLVKEFAGLTVHEEVESEAQVHNLADLEEGEVAEESRSSEAAKFYDKSKSFFDSISCDALEKKTTRLTTAEEKRLNLQTFGAPSVIRNRPSGPHNYNSGGGIGGGGFRPRSAGNFHGGDNSGGRGGYNRRGNYYGGFDKNAPNYRRGPGNNSYYTSNYSGGTQHHHNNNNNRQNNSGGGQHHYQNRQQPGGGPRMMPQQAQA